jgi:hypothetical protein
LATIATWLDAVKMLSSYPKMTAGVVARLEGRLTSLNKSSPESDSVTQARQARESRRQPAYLRELSVVLQVMYAQAY